MKKVLIATLLLCSFIAFSSFAFASDKATKDECVAMCKKAAAMVTEKGAEATYKALNDKNGPFVWKDSYVFALDSENGKILAHPMKPGLIGKDLMALKDVNGTMIFVELLKAAQSAKGEGWVNYMWPKPGEKAPSKKASYVYKVPGQNIALGAGVYE
ncbi:MAG: cache domain-containing protein [Deltaproteobacteria bacterium]|nr:cache domain-containing protein [Deltaproteobacteria bacterium]